ncbi:MAG: hypothetical protein GDA50_07950 [Alphaproteobacteria bacterium GM202ARS2]|nr:hypothetical protein [Alphaproteobacteria bacterium GM202ARS2]
MEVAGVAVGGLKVGTALQRVLAGIVASRDMLCGAACAQKPITERQILKAPGIANRRGPGGRCSGGGGSLCFAAGTPILMADGSTKPIELIEVGDKVASFPEHGCCDQPLESGAASDVFVHDDLDVMNFGDIQVTEAHPFLTDDGEFRSVAELRPGQMVIHHDGTPEHLPAISTGATHMQVFNFTVDDHHTYIAGGYRVHNSKPIVIGLNGDGVVKLVNVEDSKALFFSKSAPYGHGWVAPEDGIFAIDADGSGLIDEKNEIAFAMWDSRARTDLEGLALAYDSNRDGVFDPRDDRFAEFSIWQDANGNGTHDPGEVRSLVDVGLTSIDLTGVPYDGELSPENVGGGNSDLWSNACSF